MISANFTEFDRSLAAAERDWLPHLFNRIMRALALSAFGTVVTLTPVDTGRARNSWDCSVNTPSDFVPPEGSQSYPPADTARVLAALRSGLRMGDSIYITSNLVYIVPLNEGSSKQAPAHFAEMALQKAAADLERLVA